MDEVIYLIGSISASLLLLGHVGWLLARWHVRVRDRRPDLELTNQLTRHQQELSEQLENMSSEVQAALEDFQERLDFAERILTKSRGAPSEDERL